MLRKPLDEEEDDRELAEERREEDDFKNEDLGWEEGDPADRRKDPLRKP